MPVDYNNKTIDIPASVTPILLHCLSGPRNQTTACLLRYRHHQRLRMMPRPLLPGVASALYVGIGRHRRTSAGGAYTASPAVAELVSATSGRVR